MNYIKTTLNIFLFLIFSITLYAGDKPYVILISMDGFRWDYINRGITPNLIQMKEDGVYALSLRPAFPSKTFPNHYSIITGMHPENHGLIANSFLNIYTNELYRLGDTVSVRESKWYKGEAFWETANRHNITTASYFWVGSEQNIEHKAPTHYHNYEHNRPYATRVEGVIDWLKLSDNERPQFITLYFDEPDSRSHRFGPNSDETNEAIALVDSMLGLLLTGIKKIGWEDKVNIVVVSDHGMTEISEERRINIEEIIKDYNCRFDGTGPVMMIDTETENIDAVYSLLKQNENNYRVYTKENIPGFYHFSRNPFILPIIVIADMGWSLVNNAFLSRQRSYSFGGDHGYEKDHLDMHGIFVASGPAFRSGYKTGSLWNIDIYPLLCKIFNITPNYMIDGNIDRIEFILR